MMRRNFFKVLQCVKLEIFFLKKFIWFYWKMKKKNYYFCGFPIAGMREKNE